jgi:hypothetical protein
MNSREIRTKIVQVTGVTIVAFCGAFLHTGPPFPGYTSYLEPAGYLQYDPLDWGDRLTPDFAATFGVLVILIVIQVIAWKYLARLPRAAWIALGGAALLLFACASIAYSDDKGKWTRGVPPEYATAYYIVGDTLTRYGSGIQNSLKEKGLPYDDAHLIDRQNPEWSILQVWTKESVNKRTGKLWDEYTALMALLAAAIFLFAEGAFVRTSTKKVDVPQLLL